GLPVAGSKVVERGSNTVVEADADGRFQIEFTLNNASPGELAFYAYTATHLPAEGDLTLKPGKVKDAGPLELLVKEGRTLMGLVSHAATKEPLSGVEISLHEEVLPGIPREDWTDADGFYFLQGLPHSGAALEAKKDGFMPLVVSVSLSGEIDSRSDFEMRPTGTVNLLVKTIEGDPIAGATVQATSGQFRMLFPFEDTDKEGRSLLEGIPLDGAQVVVSKSGFTDVASIAHFPPASTTTELDVTMLENPFNVDGWYTGTVKDETGKQIEGAVVSWEPSRSFSGRGGRSATTDSDGVYLLEVNGTAYPEAIHLAALSDGYSAAYLTPHDLPRPGTKEDPANVDFQLQLENWLDIRVVDEDGEPIQSLVRIHPHLISRHGAWRALPGYTKPIETVDGHTRIANLPNRPIGLMVTADAHDQKRHTVESFNLQVDIELRKNKPFTGKVVDVDTDIPVSVFRVRVDAPGASIGHWDAGRDFTDPDGRFTIDGVSTGHPVSVRVEAPGYVPFQAVRGEPHEVIPGGEPVIIPMTRGREVTGVVLDPNQQPLEGATVRLYRPPFRRISGETITTTESDRDGRFKVLDAVHPTHLEVDHPRMGRMEIKPENRRFHETEEGLVIILFPAGSLVVNSYQTGSIQPIRLMEKGQAVGPHRNPYEGTILPMQQGRHVEWDDLQPGDYRIMFQGAEGLPFHLGVTVQIDPEEPTILNLDEYLGPHHVRISLNDPTETTAPGNRWDHPRIWLYPEDRPEVVYMARGFSPGEAHFPRLPSGAYIAIVEHFRQGLGLTEFGMSHLTVDQGGKVEIQWSPLEGFE
ncbi:MAG: carboxypeptidase regulatory-like domain-containing protein, partial [Candidatus Sumerlaeia bacterium]|nr:carboxypeptidase regulatory-like domain-containing protein [Candidatus Sumerlaeia bacterium]